MKWLLLNSQIPTSPGELQKIILKNRQIKDIDNFFSPKKPILISLDEMGIDESQVKRAIKILKTAKKNKNKIIIFGDYDADGICATAILWRVLFDLGYNVLPFIPDRKKHGYGLTIAAIDDILESHNPDLIITVDNGIVAHPAVSYLKEKKIGIIVTDHHQQEKVLPDADAIVHTTNGCGASVAWIFAREILKEEIGSVHEPNNLGTKFETIINRELDLAGVATIADQVPLLGTNRAFAKWGIDAISQSKRIGLRKLLKLAQLKQDSINSNSINFGIAPRINAIGRLHHGIDALKLLCTPNEKQADQLATHLNQINIDRQDLTFSQIETAMVQIEDQLDQNLLFAHSDQFHEGIIGLIAGKLMEKHYKPTIVLSLEETTAKASARSIPGINIVELIREVKDDLLAAGGHPMAAGFSVENQKIDLIKEKLQKLAKNISPELFERSLKVECALPLNMVNVESLQVVRSFAPFGQKNKEPVFAFEDLTILDLNTIGSQNEHLKLVVSDASGTYITVLAWRHGQKSNTLKPGDNIKIAGTLSQNVWRNKSQMQIEAKDIQLL